MKKMNRKGFTLIELLAVIVILALLMAVAIPSVTKYIDQSRRNTLVSSIESFISAATTSVNNREYGTLSDPSVLWYIPVSDVDDDSCIALERGGSNPFGDWGQSAYVVVHYNAKDYSYDYWFTYVDDAGYGMELTKAGEITKDSIVVPFTAYTATTITDQTISYACDSDGDGDYDETCSIAARKKLTAGNCDKANATTLP